MVGVVTPSSMFFRAVHHVTFVFVAVWLVLSVSSCAQRDKFAYVYSSELGRQCYYDCQRGRYACKAGCLNNGSCHSRCVEDETICYGTCPDLKLEQR